MIQFDVMRSIFFITNWSCIQLYAFTISSAWLFHRQCLLTTCWLLRMLDQLTGLCILTELTQVIMLCLFRQFMCYKELQLLVQLKLLWFTCHSFVQVQSQTLMVESLVIFFQYLLGELEISFIHSARQASSVFKPNYRLNHLKHYPSMDVKS